MVHPVMKQNIWTLSSLFANACITGLSTLLPLYIISLDGTVLDVALALSLFNFSLIVSALFWGYLIDSFGWRKRLIVISYSGLVLGIIAMYSITNIVVIAILYALIGFMRQGSQPAINLLLIETTKKKDWVCSNSINLRSWNDTCLIVGNVLDCSFRTSILFVGMFRIWNCSYFNSPNMHIRTPNPI